MTGAKERLAQLLALAAERRWEALVHELSCLVRDWPGDYPQSMRSPVLALFAWALRECDGETRAAVATEMGGHPEVPLHLLNELYLAAPAPLRREILMRNQLEREDDEPSVPADAASLLSALRSGGRDFAAMLGSVCAIPHDIAQAILSDASGEPLAVLCRGAALDRAVFSAVALLHAPQSLPLDVYDTVPEHAARRLTGQWRSHHDAPPLQAAAAE